MGAAPQLTMRRPARLMLAGSGALFLEAYLAGSALPAILGLALLLYLVHTRAAAQDGFAAVRLAAERHVAEPIVHEMQPCTVVLDTSATVVPARVRVAFDDVHPPEVVPAQPAHLEGPGRLQYRAVPQARGEATLHAVRATLTEDRGLWSGTRLHATRTSLQVHPPRHALEVGRRLARRTTFDATMPHPLAQLVRDFEYETARPFQPGDRLRDVDWKRVAAGRGLLAKQWEREQEATVLLLVDASRTMRARPAASGETNLDHAASLALQVAEVAAQKNFPVGVVLFDEVHVLEEVAPTRDRVLPQRLSRALSEMPARITAARRLDAGLPADMEIPAGDLPFLAALARWRQPGSAGPREARGVAHAMRRVLTRGRRGRLLVVAFTDLEALPGATLQSLGRAAAEGHQVVAAVLPETRGAADALAHARDLENAYRRRTSRMRARAALRAQGIATIDLAVDDTAATVFGAAREGGVRGRGA